MEGYMNPKLINDLQKLLNSRKFKMFFNIGYKDRLSADLANVFILTLAADSIGPAKEYAKIKAFNLRKSNLDSILHWADQYSDTGSPSLENLLSSYFLRGNKERASRAFDRLSPGEKNMVLNNVKKNLEKNACLFHVTNGAFKKSIETKGLMTNKINDVDSKFQLLYNIIVNKYHRPELFHWYDANSDGFINASRLPLYMYSRRSPEWLYFLCRDLAGSYNKDGLSSPKTLYKNVKKNIDNIVYRKKDKTIVLSILKSYLKRFWKNYNPTLAIVHKNITPDQKFINDIIDAMRHEGLNSVVKQHVYGILPSAVLIKKDVPKEDLKLIDLPRANKATSYKLQKFIDHFAPTSRAFMSVFGRRWIKVPFFDLKRNKTIKKDRWTCKGKGTAVDKDTVNKDIVKKAQKRQTNKHYDPKKQSKKQSKEQKTPELVL